MFGFVLLVISTAGIPYIIDTSSLTADNSIVFYPILTAVAPLVKLFAYILMGIGSVVYSIKKIAWRAGTNFSDSALRWTAKH
jgi:hypothetical protein